MIKTELRLLQIYLRRWVSISYPTIYSKPRHLTRRTIKMVAALKNFDRYEVSSNVFMLFLVIFSMESLKKCNNNDHTCLIQCINISCVSRKKFEPTINRVLFMTSSLFRYSPLYVFLKMHYIT